MAAPPEVTREQVLAWRARRHLLAPRGDLGAVDVVRRLCGAQAQVVSSAVHAVAARQERPRPGEVAEALRARRLVRTWAARGTLHLLPADTAPAHLALVAAARTWEKGAWQRAFLGAADLARLHDAVAEALVGRELTRAELVEEVARRTGDAGLAEQVRSGWAAVLKPLAWQGLLCQADSRGTEVTFARPEDLVPGWGPLPDVEEAAAVVVPAWLGAHGPGGPAELDAWLTRGATGRARVRAWFAGLGDALADVVVEGRVLQVRAADLDDLLAAGWPEPTVRLLPGFDAWLLGPGTVDTLVLDAARRPAVSRAGGWVAPVVVLDGRVAGTWAADGEVLRVELFAEAPDVPAGGLEAEAGRVARHLARDLRLAVTRA